MAGVSRSAGDGREPSSSYSALPAVSRTQQVREQLEAAIERGDYKPGERLPSERDLVELLGVSRVSVREAIRSLEAVGMVEVRHGLGCFVAANPSDKYASSFSHWLAVHRDEVLELLKVRGALDELAAESAAVSADGSWTARLRELNDSFRATPPTDIDALVERDVGFHDALGEASGSPLLADLLRELHETFNESRHATLQPSGRPAESAREHDAIIDAIERRDPAAARAAVAAHLASVRDSLTTLLETAQKEDEE
ncbi:MAG: FadR family transcriptional regulator [Thermoleophilaceae bacterium]|nr:FadR family transcriptional regulator [Thermoleophilaceae bacterium]